MSTEKIVADYETCKKAWDIGLRIESVFGWRVWAIDTDEQEQKVIYTPDFNKDYPAPTAEEVPLPDSDSFDYYLKTDVSSGVRYLSLFERCKEEDEELHCIEIVYKHKKFEINEATARLRMTIWLIENVEEAKEWYIKQGFLHA